MDGAVGAGIDDLGECDQLSFDRLGGCPVDRIAQSPSGPRSLNR